MNGRFVRGTGKGQETTVVYVPAVHIVPPLNLPDMYNYTSKAPAPGPRTVSGPDSSMRRVTLLPEQMSNAVKGNFRTKATIPVSTLPVTQIGLQWDAVIRGGIDS